MNASRNRLETERNRKLKLGSIDYAQTYPITFGTRVCIKSTIDNSKRTGRVVNFPELNVIRVRYSSGFEELVYYPHSMHSNDENLNYSKIGLTEDVNTVINSGHGVSQFIDRDELVGNSESSSASSSSSSKVLHHHSTTSEIASAKYERILMNGAQGYVTHLIKVEELKKFDAIDGYFNNLIGKSPRITINQEIGRNLPTTRKVTVSNTSLPSLSNDDNPSYGREIPDDSGLIIGACIGKVARRSADWLIKLRDVIVNINGENLLFKALAIKIDPSNIVSTSTRNMNDYNTLHSGMR